MTVLHSYIKKNFLTNPIIIHIVKNQKFIFKIVFKFFK